MPISVVQKTEPRNVNIPLAGAIGSATGLALRQFVPVCNGELNDAFFGQAREIKRAYLMNSKKALLETTKVMFANTENKEALQLFAERVEAKSIKELNKIKEKINTAPECVKKEIQAISQEFTKKLRILKHVSESGLKNIIKQERPIAPFLVIGSAFGLASAFVYNVVGKISEK